MVSYLLVCCNLSLSFKIFSINRYDQKRPTIFIGRGFLLNKKAITLSAMAHNKEHIGLIYVKYNLASLFRLPASIGFLTPSTVEYLHI